MATVIPADLEQFVQDAVASGRYQSPEEVIADGLRLLRDRNLEWQRLRAEVQERIASLERGEGIVVEGEDGLRAFFDEIEAEVAAELAAEKRQSDEQV